MEPAGVKINMRLLSIILFLLIISSTYGQQGRSNPCHPETPSLETPPSTCLRNVSGGAITCEGICGKTLSTAAGRDCSCGPYCVLYKNCCPQFKPHCPKEYVKGMEFLTNHVHLKMDCTSFHFLTEDDDGKRQSFKEMVSLISSCLNGEHCVKTSVEDVGHPNLAVPITETVTGLDYINFHCAKCNNVKDVRWWNPRLECDEPANDGLPVVTRSHSLMPLLKRCKVHYISPKGIGCPETRYGCIPESSHPISSCPADCQNKNLKRQCESSVTNDFFKSGKSLYSNFFCARCANKSLDDLMCFNQSAPPSMDQDDKHSLAILYQFDKTSGLRVGEDKCPPGEVLDEGKQSCRRAFCPENFSHLKEGCVPIVYKIVTSAVIYFPKPHHMVRAFLWFKANNRTKIAFAEEMKKALDNKASKFDEFSAEVNAEMITPSVLNVSYIYFPHNESTDHELDKMQRSVKMSLEKVVFDWLQEIKANISHDSIHVNDVLLHANSYHADCSWAGFPADSFTITNHTATYNKDKKEYTANKFRVWGTKIFVCTEPEPIKMAENGLSSSQIFLIVMLALCVLLVFGAVLVTRNLKSALKWKRMR